MSNDDTEGGFSQTEPSSSPDQAQNGKGGEAGVVIRAVLMIVIIAAGVLGMSGLVMLKKVPTEAKVSEPNLSVAAINVMPEDVPVTVTGLGDVRALNVVPISPQVAGNVVGIHPRLEMGEIIPAGELLFQIDPRDYQAARDQAAAQAAQLEKTVERLTRQYEIDQDRLGTLDRNQSLMQDEFERVKTLYEEDDVGTRSAVDHAEMNLNQTADIRDQLAQAVELYPVRIQEAQSGLEAARAQLSLSDANLARTEIRADFDARIKQVALEKGQYVSPGMQVVTLADDRILEISVSLDSRDARDWLQFSPPDNNGPSAWLGEVKPVQCTVSWTEDPKNHRWDGTVHRVEYFDPNTRTVTIAVRVSSDAARSSTGGLPLVEGMFCAVEIPGKTMEQVYRLPRWAVSYEGEVYLSRDNRLVIQPVDVVRSEREETFVRGLAPGDTVVTTRLSNPMPNILLTIREEEKVGS